MLRGGLRTKDGKIIAAIMGLSAVIIGGCVFAGYSQNRQFLERAVVAENYLESGNYEQAIETYEQALSMKDSDEELLTIGLADAYIGTNNYDKALEVLRSYYQKTSKTKVKEKIEEVISEKTDYEYSQSILRAEIYFTKEEYKKAIEIYEEAKLIKRKDPIAYQRIAESYINLGEYDLALQEVTEGQIITQNESLSLTLAVVNSYLVQDQYDTLLEQAEEYILQENYEDGIAKYEEAINLMPKKSEAYAELGRFYINRAEYDKAIPLLKEAVELVNNDEVTDLLSQATEQMNIEKEIESILNMLCKALENRNTTAVTTIMKSDFFTEEVAADPPVYYGFGEEEDRYGLGMIIYDSENVYYGDIKYDVRNGKGIYFTLTEGNPEPGYYYYDGEWDKDLPNGSGKTMEMKVLTDLDGQSFVSKTQTEGIYTDATENGRMAKYFYIQGKETKRLSYTAQNGIPLPLALQNSVSIPTPQLESYVIGILSLKDELTEEYYRVEPQTIWGVKPFISNTNSN